MKCPKCKVSLVDASNRHYVCPECNQLYYKELQATECDECCTNWATHLFTYANMTLVLCDHCYDHEYMGGEDSSLEKWEKVT